MAGAVRAGRAAHVLRSKLQEAQREKARAQLAQWLPTLGPWLQAARHKRKRPAGSHGTSASPPRSARPRLVRREQSSGSAERRVLLTTATAVPAMQAGPAGQVGPAVPAWQTAQAGPSRPSRRSSSSESCSSRDTSPLSVSGAPGLGPGLAVQGLLSAHALLALGAEERGEALAAITGGALIPTPTLTLWPQPYSSP